MLSKFAKLGFHYIYFGTSYCYNKAYLSKTSIQGDDDNHPMYFRLVAHKVILSIASVPTVVYGSASMSEVEGPLMNCLHKLHAMTNAINNYELS